jgi:hypothetical protein
VMSALYDRIGRTYIATRSRTRASRRSSTPRWATRGQCSTSAPGPAPTSPATATLPRSSRPPSCARSARAARPRASTRAPRRCRSPTGVRRHDGRALRPPLARPPAGLRELRRVARRAVVFQWDPGVRRRVLAHPRPRALACRASAAAYAEAMAAFGATRGSPVCRFRTTAGTAS